MRGKVAGLGPAKFEAGITPAHAGKRPPFAQRSETGKYHPRTCGEKTSVYQPTNFEAGSPPHMRGKETISCQVDVDAGITPAHAGKR